MPKPIFRMAKMKRTGTATPASVSAHLDRTRPTPNADPAKTKFNRALIGAHGDDLNEAINGLMLKAGIDPSKLRKDATIANDLMLTLSPEFFRPDDPERAGHYDPRRVKAFEAEAVAWLKETFGEHLVRAELHLDESTPHIHAVMVPIMPKLDKDGQRAGNRLSSKDFFNPQSLTKLQDSYEARMVRLGVDRRTKNSQARHTTVKEFYATLEGLHASKDAQPIKVGKPPSKSLLEGSAAYEAKVLEWQKAETKRLRQEQEPVVKAAAAARLYEAERIANGRMRGELVKAKAENAPLRATIEKVQAETQRTKDEIAALRATPINAVADRLGFTGRIGPKENAIDLVKRHGGLGFNEAVAWLAQNFGQDVAGTAVRENAAAKIEELTKGPRIQTKSEKVKASNIIAQCDALAAPAYRLTLVPAKEGAKPYNVGKGRGEDGAERFYTRDEIVAMIPQLTARNVNGAQVYVTPKDETVEFVLIDDLNAANVELLKAKGFRPATITETSPNNFQAVLKVPKSVGFRAAVNELFKDLNRVFGDARITGLTHPFRLAGFENRKEKHQDPSTGYFPYVRLKEAVNQVCEKTVGLVKAYSLKEEKMRCMIEQQEAAANTCKPRGPRM